VEANCKAIFRENECPEPRYKNGRIRDWNMGDYKRIEVSHHLSRYEVRFPLWRGNHSIRQPFAAWKDGKSLGWYEAYNESKHDRHDAFEKATFSNVVDALSGLLVLLSAQFHRCDFAPADYLSAGEIDDGFESAIGDYLRVRFPKDWSPDERYDFNWGLLKQEPNPFQNFDYSKI
ncbi:MAG TPA: hypothetical protein VK530_00790, partial [Candidatus Acidoferrum sp.]|nr:hypothetical protein [Candidatus Acidoferrum sp.]